ncbi:MAG TPA: NDP-sugar synthase [Acidimicrobiales bacterium]
MRAVVLVGGEGSRLRPLTFTTPKQMLPVGGRPMIERVLEQLAEHGVDEAVLSLGYRPDAFIDAYPDGTCVGVKLVYAVEDSPLDTAGAIRFAAQFARIDDTFVVVNGDVLTGLDVSGLVAFHRDRQAEATIALTPVEDPSAFGVVPTDAVGRVVAFIEKPPRDEAPTNLINAGTYVLEASVLARIPGGRRVSIERETFPSLVGDGRLYAWPSEADWVDAGTPATFLAANLRYAGAVGVGSDVADGASVDLSVLGAGVRVGDGAVVEASVCFDEVDIAPGAQVRASIIGRGARIERDAVISDLSVVGDGAVVPAGARLAGDRHPVSS